MAALTRERKLEILAARATMKVLPDKLRENIVWSVEFREKAALRQDVTLNFGSGGPAVDRATLVGKVRSLFSGTKTATIRDKVTNEAWSIVLAKDGKTALLKQGKRRAGFDLAFLVNPVRGQRISGFEELSTGAEFTESEHQAWLARINKGPLDDDGIDEIDALVRAGPQSIVAHLRATLSQASINLGDLIPSQPDYYERLVGTPTNSIDIESYAADEARSLVGRILRAGEGGFLRRTLLLAAQQNLAATLADVAPKAELDRSLPPDILSMLGYLEFLCKLPLADFRTNELIRTSAEVRERISTDKKDVETLSILFRFVECELARLGLFEQAPPFWRRMAALAHAGMLWRTISPELLSEPSFRSHLQNRTPHAFPLATLLDLRKEPRWLPSYASEEQLRWEIIGRLIGAVNAIPLELRETETELGKEVAQVFALLEGPMKVLAFLPGPCEGSAPAKLTMADELRSELLASLQTRPVALPALQALIAHSLVFRIDDEFAKLAVDGVRELTRSSHDRASISAVANLLSQLASLAAVCRSPPLADEVRILCRVLRRQEPAGISPELEFEACLLAAAAREDINEYAPFLGSWLREISSEEISERAAIHINLSTRFLAYRSAKLWPALAPSISLTEISSH